MTKQWSGDPGSKTEVIQGSLKSTDYHLRILARSTGTYFLKKEVSKVPETFPVSSGMPQMGLDPLEQKALHVSLIAVSNPNACPKCTAPLIHWHRFVAHLGSLRLSTPLYILK